MISSITRGWKKTNATAPAINIRETETNYEIEVAAPGMTREDFTIKIENNNQLVVSMEKKHEQKEDKKEEGRYLRREFSYTRFQQAMILPDDVVKREDSGQDGTRCIDHRYPGNKR